MDIYRKKNFLIPYNLNIKQSDAEMSLSDHLEELRQRAFWSVSVLITSIIICVFSVKNIVKVLQEPALGIKFLQFAPGEYFFASIKVAAYTGLLISSPFLIYQIILFVLPGMTKNERKTILPIILGALTLFLFGLMFGYSILVPAALNFFINYGSEVVEPFWSFEQYFEFILILLFSTGLAFQLPVLQIMLGLLRIVSGETMLSIWRYVILGSTIIGAILTPSVDPLTQILMSSIVVVLYFLGAGIVLLIEKK
uniref:Sec-independent translocase component C n=1 Tax=Cryptomonas curvata TaxID=233186 RepID=A0A222AHF0_9CRYP|nr:Sec-independent translocase component C [Cryptomonas curvata]ASO75791.1 Sec-independent translocase component C [Cryptomonas curvata]